MDNKNAFNELFESLDPKLKFPLDAGVSNVWAVYEPTFYAEVLLSEQKRNIYAEAFDFTNVQLVDSLRILVLQFLLGNYKGGPLKEIVQMSDRLWVGERIDIEMPVQDLVELDNDTFWKRVARKKCKNKTVITEALLDKYFPWKCLAIESKMVELFENTKKTEWNEERINGISKSVSPYVFKLEISQLQAIDDLYLEKNRYNPLYKICNYPPRDCHHGLFGSALGELCNLESLSLKFGIQTLEFKYHKRYFEMSFEDIASLSKGLSRLVHLKHLAITNSRLDDRKCKMLVRGFLHCPLETLDLTYCHLQDNAGKALGYLLKNSKGTLKSLELAENHIGPTGWQAIGFGIQNYAGELEYIGMSANPVGEMGIVAIGGGICGLEQLKRIDMSRIQIDNEGPFRLVQMVGFHKRLKWLSLNSVELGEYLGDKLIDMVNEQWELEYLAVRRCGLTRLQERKLRVLINRNTFYLKNPCMKKDFFTVEDEQEIDEWIVQIKHPVMKKLLDDTIEPKYCEHEQPPKLKGNHILKLVPKKQRIIQLNSELLNTFYIDCFGTDSDMYLYDPKKHNEKTEEGMCWSESDDFNYNPNEYSQNEFLDDVLLGSMVELNSPQYFTK